MGNRIFFEGGWNDLFWELKWENGDKIILLGQKSIFSGYNLIISPLLSILTEKKLNLPATFTFMVNEYGNITRNITIINRNITIINRNITIVIHVISLKDTNYVIIDA